MRVAGVLAFTVVAIACSSYGEAGGGVPSSADGGTPTSEGGTTTACPSIDAGADLLAWYPFDETSGSRASDCSGNGLHASSVGTPPAWVDGHSPASGRALDVNGGGCLAIGASPKLAFDSTSKFTIAVWLKPRQFATSGDARFIVARRTASPRAGWSLATDDPEHVEMNVADGEEREISSPIERDAWVHVAAVYDGAVRVYVRGLLATTGPAPVPLAAEPSATARIACDLGGLDGYDGLLDDLRIYGRALTDAEITALAQP